MWQPVLQRWFGHSMWQAQVARLDQWSSCQLRVGWPVRLQSGTIGVSRTGAPFVILAKLPMWSRSVPTDVKQHR